MVKKSKRSTEGDGTKAEISGNSLSQISRLSFADAYTSSVQAALEARKEYQILETEDGIEENLTPPLLEDHSVNLKLFQLNEKITDTNKILLELPDQSTKKRASKIMVGRDPKATLDETMAVDTTEDDGVRDSKFTDEEPKRVLPFIKIVLRRTSDFLLLEMRSNTVPRDSDKANKIEEDNKFYDYITVGKGRVRRTNTSEAQTTDVLCKSRDVNTERIQTNAVISYVSNFEMFDTYKHLETTTKKVEVGDAQQINVTTYKVGGVDQFEIIKETENFKLALMITLRMLAGNVYEEEQRRFRNMILPDPLAQDIMFTYSLQSLFSLDFEPVIKKRKAIADIDFCPGNGDILAVAYGIFAYGTSLPDTGYCCIWNIKNPVNPERTFCYNMAVVTVRFSPTMPQLLAIGLFDGSVEVRNIEKFDDPPIAVSPRVEDATCDPITAIEWLPQAVSGTSDVVEFDPFLALSQDGSVTKYRIINSPNLLAFPQMRLDRIEGSPEGILVKRQSIRLQSNRCPQGITMILHPRFKDIYFLLTDEGCIHRCSTNYPHQHLEVLQVHVGSVNSMDFSPWSPKIFLTAGNDWCIRIWMEGIFQPLITLKNENCPILSAAWSKTHSTIIISNTRKAICVWDIRRSALKPVNYKKSASNIYTLLKFSRCGRSLAIGKERGFVSIKALEKFPFPPHFQYNELELAIYKAVSMNPELTNELKTIGYFGYPQHRFSKHCD